MKFGKFIQTQQSEWQGHYMSYKGLKKIINSLEALPAPANSYSITVVAAAPPDLSLDDGGLDSSDPHHSRGHPTQPHVGAHTETGTAVGSATTKFLQGTETREMRALKTAFFYRLERELEKVNNFYLQKESELKVRLRSLEDKKRLVAVRQRRMGALVGGSGDQHGVRVDVAALQGLKEGFLSFLAELTKVQKFVDINATGFRKILKKWDKRSHGAPTKDLYLARQVEIQPVFSHRDVLAELSDRGSSNLQEIEGTLEAAGVGEIGGPAGHETGMADAEERHVGGGSDDGREGDDMEDSVFGKHDPHFHSTGTSPLTAAAVHAIHQAASHLAPSGALSQQALSFGNLAVSGSGADADFYLDLEQQISRAAKESRLGDLHAALEKRRTHAGTAGGATGGFAALNLPPAAVAMAGGLSLSGVHSDTASAPMSPAMSERRTSLIPGAAGHTGGTPTWNLSGAALPVPVPGQARPVDMAFGTPTVPAIMPLGASPPSAPADSDFVSRMFLRLVTDAPLASLQALLGTGEVDPGFRDDISDRTALHEIAITGRMDILEELIKYIGERVAGKDSLAPIPLTKASLLNAVDIHSRTPLHYVAMYGHVDCARAVLAEGASMGAQDLDGWTPLVHAIVGGHTEVVKTFLENGAEVEPTLESDPVPLCLACAGGNKEIVRLLLERGAKMTVADAEGLYPLHISARSGNAAICRLLLDRGCDTDTIDRYNGWSPLFYAASEGHKDAVNVLLEAGVSLDLLDESGWDAAAYAVYHGHVNVGSILREKRAETAEPVAHSTLLGAQSVSSILKESETGTLEVSRVDDIGPNKEPITPSALFANPSSTPEHSISSQATATLTLLSSPRIKAMAEPPLDLPPLDDLEDLPESLGVGSIPPLSLPPPIVPFRIYGHNFLDRRMYVQMRLGHRLKSGAAAKRRDPIALFGSRQLSSLKLIISAKPESGGSLPYNIILPLKDDTEVFTFLVDSLPTLQFDIYPTFGTKVIARGALLPSNLGQISREGRGDGSSAAERCIIPLLDTHLRVVGEMCFECEIVTPFRHKGVVIGGRVETYWKSTRVVSSAKPSSANFLDADASMANTGGIAVNTLLQPLAVPLNPAPSVQSFVEASSLAEEYIVLAVQLTRDGVPVIFPHWYIRIGGTKGSTIGQSSPIQSGEDSETGILVSVSDITVSKFKQLGERASDKRRRFESCRSNDITSEQLVEIIHESFVTLDEVLETVPTRVGVNIEIKYPTSSQQSILQTAADRHSVNGTVDAVLRSVYDKVGSGGEQRSVIFMSSNPAVCTATNWKQPNYAVFFRTHAGYASLPESFESVVESQSLQSKGEIEQSTRELDAENIIEDDERCKSIKEAIRFAKAGNLLGIVCEAAPLVEVPALINTVKEAGLILATFGSTNHVPQNVVAQHFHGVDAILLNSVMKYNVA